MSVMTDLRLAHLLDRDPDACRTCDRLITPGQAYCPNGHPRGGWAFPVACGHTLVTCHTDRCFRPGYLAKGLRRWAR